MLFSMILIKRRIYIIRFVIMIKHKAVDYYASKKFLVLKCKKKIFII